MPQLGQYSTLTGYFTPSSGSHDGADAISRPLTLSEGMWSGRGVEGGGRSTSCLNHVYVSFVVVYFHLDPVFTKGGRTKKILPC